jgi:uncharacterized protein HemY
MLLAALPLAAFVVWKLWRRGGIKELSEASRAWARGDADGAIDMLGAYVARHPRQIAAWKMLIDIHLDRGEFGEATQCCNAMEALGVLDPIELTGARNYVAMRRELDERAKGAGLLDTPGGDAPPSDESSDGSTHDA